MCSEPVGAVGDPPTGGKDGDGRGESPPEGQQQVGDKAKRGEGKPEHLALHEDSVRLEGPFAAQGVRDLRRNGDGPLRDGVRKARRRLTDLKIGR